MIAEMKQLEHNLKSYNYIKEKVEKLRDKLAYIKRIMYDPSTVKYDQETGHGRTKTIEDYITEKEETEKEIEYYENIIEEVERKVNRLQMGELRVIHDYYISKKSSYEIADENLMDYKDAREIEKEAKQILKKMLDF